ILNDHSYLNNEFKCDDARWVNRPVITVEAVALAQTEGTYQQRVNSELKKMITLRKQNEVFGASSTQILETYRPHLFAYCRHHEKGTKLLVICNFSEYQQTLPNSICDVLGTRVVKDILNQRSHQGDSLQLNPFDVLWLQPQ
ncbi:alpha amylase C-terminal domain-containing protein, partial [Vibrio cholerae]